MRCVTLFACLLGLPLFVQGQELPAKEVIDPVKRSTVFVQVEGGDWKGSGSGFVVKATKDALLVATNYHVLAGTNSERRIAPAEALRIARAAKVNLIFDSGAKGERSAKAEVVAIDPDVDLAILRVTGLADPPTPIGLASADKLVETMSVYSFGFPFGKALGVGEKSPAVTVGKAAISSLRNGDDGKLSVIQIDGNLNPGNSGGPIVDVKGQLVGIAVAKIRDGQGIGFAIPAAELTRMLNGGLGRPHVAAIPGVKGKVTVKVEVGVIDPDSAIRNVSAHYVVVAPNGMKLGPNDPLAKAAGAKRIALKIEGNVAIGEITLDKPAGALFVQTSLDGRGAEGLSAIRSVDLTAAALLAAGKPPAGWKEYFSKGNEFSVWIPEQANRNQSHERDVTIDGLQFHNTSLRVLVVGDLLYMTDFLTIPKAISDRLTRAELEESFRKWVASEQNGKVVDDVEVQLEAVLGREFRIESRGGRASVARLFVLGDGKVLVLQVGGPNAALKGERAAVFLNSCRLSPPAAARPVAPRPVAKIPPMRPVDLPRVPTTSLPPKTIERVKLPPSTERDRATALARDLFKEEFALTDLTARAEFAKKLLQQAAETDDDPVSQFVLYRESAQLAAASDIELALQACDAIVARFEGSTAEVLEPVLEAIAAKTSKPEAAGELANFVIRRIEDALAADEVDTAGRLHKIAEQSAVRSKVIKIGRQAQTLASEIAFLRSIQDKLNAAKATLKAKPDDAEANLILGKHVCFLRGDWKAGLPMLAKSSDETLKKIAAKEMEAGEDDGRAAVSAGDAWHEQLSSIKDYPKTQIQLHIHSLYSRALPTLTGLTKSKVENRLDELDKTLQGKFANAALWPFVRAAVRNQGYEKTQIMGGAFGDPDYSELPASGGILIGFHYTYKRFGNQDSIDCFQPIYLTPTGERLGQAHGDMTKGVMMTLKAKANYAIGKMAIRGGGLWGGTNVVFMRIDGNGLKASDSYESGWIGHTDQPNSPFLGDGRPIVGIFGKNQRDDVGICSIGFYVIGEKPADSR